MKSNAPWSVKGIERDARETAKEAARREGMTVGEWLNQIIYSAGDPDAPGNDDREIEGLQIRDLASAIEHLSRRAAGAEARSAEAVESLARSVGGVVERVQRLERTKPIDSAGAEDLAGRVHALEEKSQDRQRIEALRALEKAVSQVALQFNTAHQAAVSRIDSTERQLQELASRIDERSGEDSAADAVGYLKDAIDGMAARITRAERIATEASKLRSEADDSFDTDFVEKTGARLRVLGDEIKRGGDQIRGLEATIVRLSEQIDAAERRSSEGVQKVSETIAELRDRFSGADNAEIEAAVSAVNQRTEDRIATLQRSFDDMVRRLEEAGAQTKQHAAVLAAASKPEVTTPFDENAPTDDDVEEAFASIDLDEIDELGAPPTAYAAPAGVDHAAKAVADFEDETASKKIADEEDDLESAFEDDFDFGFDDDDASPDNQSAIDAEAKAALSDVREAFGLSPEGGALASARAATPAAQPAEFDEIDDLIFEEREAEAKSAEAKSHVEDIAGVDDEDDDDSPPAVFGRKGGSAGESTGADDGISGLADEIDAPAEDEDVDYLKAARRAAREAAARAETEQADAQSKSRKKLTPKQRAILAARLKRRKLEELRAKEVDAPIAPPAAPEIDRDDDDKASSVKARIMSAIAKVKARAPSKADAKTKVDAQPPAADAATIDEKGNPNIAGQATGLLRTLKAKPLMGGIVGLGVAIVLLTAALFVMTKDVLFRGKAPAVRPVAEAPAQTAPVTAADQTLRPRDLYLESYTALRSAESDAQEQAALKGLEQAAALGHPPAQLQIGELYKIGQGYPKDLSKARQWYERAATGGNVLAMHRLGVMAARGEGGPVDPAGSIRWFEQAANFGLLDSQYNLGATYHPTGEASANSIQDRAKAYFWYSLASQNGDSQAGELAAGLAADMPAAEKAEKDAEIAAWTPQTPDAAANEIAPAN